MKDREEFYDMMIKTGACKYRLSKSGEEKMERKKNYQITEFCHRFLADHIEEGSCCIDATCGNGNDTEFLCRMAGPSGRVYAFDIQKEAVERTKERLARTGYEERAELYCAGHEHMTDYVREEVDVIMFNFGYLPGGDHAVATHPDTSLQGIRQGMTLLKKGGVMSLCIYSGGDTGYEERDMLMDYLKDLDPARWLVIVCSYYNRKNDPPLPVFVIRM